MASGHIGHDDSAAKQIAIVAQVSQIAKPEAASGADGLGKVEVEAICLPEGVDIGNFDRRRHRKREVGYTATIGRAY